MYEHKRQPLASKKTYYKRIVNNIGWSAMIIIFMLAIGTIGYYYSISKNPDWYDAFHNASMILSGMGPVVTDIKEPWGKIFSSLYALFSGVIFITSIGYILAPAVHRFFHKLHLEDK
ncbi:MAG: hypothetical protein EKK37_05605 [Sphingobacteriales bacterium]|nr:MAG: hypothetical protein EKK37_05605 [Sphingobacteriales bacterium]